MSNSTERNCNKCIHHTSGMCDSWDCNMQTVEDVKNEAVNEYVKSVVEELEALKDGYDHSCFDNAYERGVEAGAKWIKKKAIEIVKQCGVSDDVCEWELDGVYIFSPHSKMFSCVIDDKHRYTYCPVCGKKIKVAE